MLANLPKREISRPVRFAKEFHWNFVGISWRRMDLPDRALPDPQPIGLIIFLLACRWMGLESRGNIDGKTATLNPRRTRHFRTPGTIQRRVFAGGLALGGGPGR
jgi:hypothetical protein